MLPPRGESWVLGGSIRRGGKSGSASFEDARSCALDLPLVRVQAEAHEQFLAPHHRALLIGGFLSLSYPFSSRGKKSGALARGF